MDSGDFGVRLWDWAFRGRTVGGGLLAGDGPARRGCCGELHVHAGLRRHVRSLARRKVDALGNGG